VNSKPRRVPEVDVSEGSTEYHAKFVAPHYSSEGDVTRLELERQLSVLLAGQTKRDQPIARLTALLEQAEANATEAAKRTGLELREHADRLLMQTSLVEQRDAELVDMQARLRDMQAKLDELPLSRDQEIGQYEKKSMHQEMGMARALNSDTCALYCRRFVNCQNGLAPSSPDRNLRCRIVPERCRRTRTG
jgi:hypothetical protein